MTPAADVSLTPNRTDQQVAAISADDVADRIEVVAGADRALADVIDWIGGRRAPVCVEAVTRLDWLLGRLREGVRVRAELTVLDPALLRAGGVLWIRRRSAARSHAASATTGGIG
jgi:hypothetical protein